MGKLSTTPTDVPPPVSANGRGPTEDLVAGAGLGEPGPPRRWPLLLLGIAIGVGGAVAVAALLDGQAQSDAAETAPVELAIATVEERDLIEEIEWTGTLGYGEPVTISGTGGTVTAVADLGSAIGRGDVILHIDGQPVVALFGATPMWRSLSEGDTGADVRQLEANLAALGYDPEQTVDIDDTFTANTGAMVERWQEDIGAEVTGLVTLGSVVMLEGPSVVSSMPEAGSSASGPLAAVAPRAALTDVVATVDGTITSPVPVGTVVEQGTVLYRVDDEPVVAVVETDPVIEALTDPTFTDLELEQALSAGGHDAGTDLTVDGVITDATRAAIERWQESAGLPTTGQSDPGHYLALPPDLVVDGHLVADGTPVIGGGPVVTLSASRLAVEVIVDVADADEFEVGQEVTIELADETTAAGVVTVIGPVVQPADPQASPTVTVDIAVTTEGTEPVEGPVTVLSAGETIIGATVVPTRALVSLAEGGFAVERVGPDGSAELIGIEIGSFDDGMVEVVEGDVSPGDRVVVPR